jgi:hypothetical protein
MKMPRKTQLRTMTMMRCRVIARAPGANVTLFDSVATVYYCERQDKRRAALELRRIQRWVRVF